MLFSVGVSYAHQTSVTLFSGGEGWQKLTSLFSQSALTHNYDIFLWIWIRNIDNYRKYPMVDTFSWAIHWTCKARG